MVLLDATHRAIAEQNIMMVIQRLLSAIHHICIHIGERIAVRQYASMQTVR